MHYAFLTINIQITFIIIDTQLISVAYMKIANFFAFIRCKSIDKCLSDAFLFLLGINIGILMIRL